MIKYIVLVLFTFSAIAQNKIKTYNYSERFTDDEISQMKTIYNHLDSVNIKNIEYFSFDDKKIQGYLITPITKNSIEKYPIVLFNRGGNGSFGMVRNKFIIEFLSKISSKGFIIIGSQLRGSEGSEGIDEFGGKDIDDVISVLNIAKDLSIADTTKIFQVGWSRGGITNFHVLKRTNLIKGTVNIAGPSNLLNTNRKEMYKVYSNRINNYSKDSIYYTNKVSPIFQIDSIINKNTRFLLIHGDKDKNVDFNESLELKAKLDYLSFDNKLIMIENGNHSLKEYYNYLISLIITWFKEQE